MKNRQPPPPQDDIDMPSSEFSGHEFSGHEFSGHEPFRESSDHSPSDRENDGRHGRHRHGHDGPRHGPGDHRHGERGDHHGRGRGGRHRMFDYGEFRLLLLAMISERPSHGYELIKAVEERSGGSYVPSPGVAYPTLAWLDDMGYARIEPEEKGRKLYRLTPDGQAFLDENRDMADTLLARLSPSARGHIPPPVLRAMENVKFALRLRLNQESVSAEAIEAMSSALDAAAKAIERS